MFYTPKIEKSPFLHKYNFEMCMVWYVSSNLINSYAL